METSPNILFESIRALVFLGMLTVVGIAIHLASRQFLGEKYLELGNKRLRIAVRNVAVVVFLALVNKAFEHFAGTVDWILHKILPLAPAGYFSMLLSGLLQTAISLQILFLLLQLLGEIYWWAERHLAVLRNRESFNERHQKIRGSFVWDGLSLLNRAFRGVALVFLLLAFPLLFLSFFPRTQVWIDSLRQAIRTPLENVATAILEYLPNLATLAVMLTMGWLFLRLLRYVFGSISRGTLVIGDFPHEWAEPTYRLTRTLFLLFMLMVSYPYLPGSSSQFFQGFSVFAGALVTFGSAGAIGNVVAGTVLTYTRSFRIGDMVQIGANTGVIIEKTLLVTRILTPLNEEVTIPNGAVLAGEVKNFSAQAAGEGLVVTVRAGIGYDVDWRTVHELMVGAALRTPGILQSPAPFVLQLELSDYAVNYELRARTSDAPSMFPVMSSLRANVLDAFNAAGIEIMTPSIQALRDASGPAIPAERDGGQPGRRHALQILLNHGSRTVRSAGADAPPAPRNG